VSSGQDREPVRPHSGCEDADPDDEYRSVASFADRESAQAHADRLNAGPLDWDEQEAWKDDWDD
jgi:hypothetical protein